MISNFKLMQPYKPSRQCLIMIACYTIDNYICKWGLNDKLFKEFKYMDPSKCANTTKELSMKEVSSNTKNLSKLFD